MSLLPDGEEHPDAVAVLEFAEALGVDLDEWQRLFLRSSLRRRAGRWAAFAAGLCVPRQNGKNGVAEVRELAGPILLGERLLIHTAHQADTSREGFRRLDELIEANEWLSKEVKHVWRANGNEAIEFQDGRRIRFRTRTKGGGRGFSGDFVLFDEAMILSEASMGAILPVISARPDPQIWYLGSAVDEEVHDAGLVFANVRHRALERQDESLLYMEWSVAGDDPGMVEPDVLHDPEAWAQANPALGIRIREEYVAKELRELQPRTFAVERLCIGAWPHVGAEPTVISLEQWRTLADPDSTIPEAKAFAIDVSPSRDSSSISAAGVRADGLFHIEVVEQRKGTGWVVSRAKTLQERHEAPFVVDGKSPAASLLHDLEEADVQVEVINASEHAQACGLFYDLVEQSQLRHLGQPPLTGALRGAAQRPLGDAWAWSRKNSSTDITPLVSVTLALWGAATLEQRSVYDKRDMIFL